MCLNSFSNNLRRCRVKRDRDFDQGLRLQECAKAHRHLISSTRDWLIKIHRVCKTNNCEQVTHWQVFCHYLPFPKSLWPQTIFLWQAQWQSPQPMQTLGNQQRTFSIRDMVNWTCTSVVIFKCVIRSWFCWGFLSGFGLVKLDVKTKSTSGVVSIECKYSCFESKFSTIICIKYMLYHLVVMDSGCFYSF